MIIDIRQERDQIELSYVNENQQIDIETIKFDSEIIELDGLPSYCREFHNFVECDESDPNRFPSLISFKGNPIKLEKSKAFKHHNVNHFLNYEIPNYYPEIFEKVRPVRIPKLYSLDIETDITDKYGYSNQEDVENPIRSISITNENMDSILFIVRNEKYPEIDAKDFEVIRNLIFTQLGEYAYQHEYQTKMKIFDNERDMLEAFIQANYKYFHLIFGWNIYGYDLQYIFNRCEKLNIDYSRISPIRKTYDKRIEVNAKKSFTLKLPYHRMYVDYMLLFKDSLVYNNLGKYSLDYVSELVLGLNKVSYSGNLRKLYEEDYLRFIAYAYIDTILVMLLHHSVNLLNINFFQSYYTNVPYLKVGQNAISDALIYRKLFEKGKFLLSSEFSQEEVRDYAGGYVKDPTVKIVEAVAGEDYNSLYPNSLITCGISPEAYVDTISVGSDGFPNTEESRKKWEMYKSKGFCLAPTGSVYDKTSKSLYTMIEEDLLGERKLYKSFMTDIYLNIRPAIEKELAKRKKQKTLNP